MAVRADFTKLSIIRSKLNVENYTEGLLEGAKDIVKLASELAPKDTGDLSDSGEAHISGNGKVELSFGNGLPDDRAIAQEYGTVFMPAQPYLLPAIREVDILFHVLKRIKI